MKFNDIFSCEVGIYGICKEDWYLRVDGCCWNLNYIVFDDNLIKKFIFLTMVLYKIVMNMYLKKCVCKFY